MMTLIFAIICAYWFKWELKQFPTRINKMVFQNMNALFPLTFTLDDLFAHSALQPIKNPIIKLLFIALPLSGLLLHNMPFTLITISFILIYLSLLDYFYYLTEGKYVALIFMLSLIHLLCFTAQDQQPYLITLVFTLIFFSLFSFITTLLFQKEVFGSGDTILLTALSPLFTLEQMLMLIFLASMSGLLFASGYFLLKKEKLIKLPFIPFISFSTFIMWLIPT